MNLDKFQLKAIDAFKSDKNLIVTANTGSGKTLIATECINSILSGEYHKKIWYTTPIKALSNEKYNDLRKLYGKQNVGLLTGDIKINVEAQICIATTEILNNALLSGYVNIGDLSNPQMTLKIDKSQIGLVIFDEAHYINDSSRGYIWEESLIMLSKTKSKVILLSATISNVQSLKKWLDRLFSLKFETITTSKRIVPLYTKVISDSFAFVDILKDQDDHNFGKVKLSKSTIERCLKYFREKELLPAIIWILSRKNCEAQALSCDLGFTTIQEKKQIKFEISIFERQLAVAGVDNPLLLEKLKNKIIDGIACHHAGMNSLLREFIEYLFKKKLIKVVFATETFSVGINFPARSVLFTSLTKPGDSGKFKIFSPSEYIQMAGRAGRRGIDTMGYVFIIPSKVKIDEVKKLITANPDAVVSKYRVTYASVLKTYPNDISKDSFQNLSKDTQEYSNVCKVLKEHDLIDCDGLTQLGRAAACFSDIDPILAIEILKKLKSSTGREIIRALATLNCQVEDEIFPSDLTWIIDLENSIVKTEVALRVSPATRSIGSGILNCLDLWAKSVKIEEICDKTLIDEGSLIKELLKIKNIAISALRALYELEWVDTAQRVSDAIIKLFRREILPESFHMRNS